MRWVGVDWSGRRTGEERYLWPATAGEDGMMRVDGGRTRAELVRALVGAAEADPDLVVGLDFSFGLPAWFSPGGGAELWERAGVDGERWLAECLWPFWGRPGHPRPPVEQYRATEWEVLRAGWPVKSTFQIGGAGAVGTASIRGWPALRALRSAGFAVWPFDSARLPLAVEVYPRLCTGPVVKSNRAARQRWLAAHDLPASAAVSEDALDAVAVAAALAAARLTAPGPATHPLADVEGWIWSPPEVLGTQMAAW